ncbi:hypothetical protein [Cohnella cellulosilytica]|uniref:Uncharacterized protein n=1 Tax=Cohnella cellulosilytica TaxID=986710 RepID=A0ABW2F7R5_9BACL
MSAEAEKKNKNGKSYVIGAVLIAFVVLMTLVIMGYSKYVLEDQARTTDQGQRLAERYVYAQLFAERLRDGAEGFLVAKTEAERIRAAKQLAEARLAGSEALALLVEAESAASGLPREEAGKPVTEAADAVIGADGPLAVIGESGGPLTEAEIALLGDVRDAAAGIEEALKGYRAPSGEAGYRQMATLGEWKPYALEASANLQRLAAAVRR